jgi:hypothetical protein
MCQYACDGIIDALSEAAALLDDVNKRDGLS